jgi:isopentenyl-diphosphate Delta-isomerase
MEEIVDVVDGNDHTIGTAPRSEVHRSGAWHRGIHILIFNQRGNLLLQRRSAKKDKAPGSIDLSVSEHSRAGESFVQAANRGLREELGVGNLRLEQVLKFRMVYGPGDNMISVLFRADYSGEIHSDGAEVDEVFPMPIADLPLLLKKQGDKLTPWTKELLSWYVGLPSRVEEIHATRAGQNR